MSDTPNREEETEAFRRSAHALVDWIAAYWREPERFPVLSQLEPGDVRGALPAEAPERGEPYEAIMADLERAILPGVTHWNHPGFLAYFGLSSTAPGLLGDMLSTAFNVNGMLWKTSPAATELEQLALDWLRRLLGLPEGLFGVIQDTGSSSTLVALAAAREAAGVDARRRGLSGAAPLCLYVSDQTHSSAEKAAIVLGVGQDHVRHVPTDGAFRLDPEALERAVRADRQAGLTPFAVVATLGTTSTASVDPAARIADVCERYGLWLHADAAYGGAAALLPECRAAFRGWERADSVVVNPHKWLMTPIDCSALYTRRPEVMRRAFSLVPDYLRDEAEAVNYMDYGVALGRRFRALKLWFVLRWYGAQGLRAHVRRGIALARRFAGWVEADPDFELTAPVSFSVVCFRARPAGHQDGEALDRLNARLLDAVNRTGTVYASPTRLRGRTTLRIAVGNRYTDESHLRAAWALFRDHLASLQGRSG